MQQKLSNECVIMLVLLAQTNDNGTDISKWYAFCCNIATRNKQPKKSVSQLLKYSKDYRPQPKAEALPCFWAKPQRSESWLHPLLQNNSNLQQWMSLSGRWQTGQLAISSRWADREHAVKSLAAFKSTSQTQKQVAGIGTLNQVYKKSPF